MKSTKLNHSDKFKDSKLYEQLNLDKITSKFVSTETFGVFPKKKNEVSYSQP